MTKQQIPEISGVQDSKAAIILRGMKSIIEEMTGRSKVAIQYLDGATSSSGVINKINEVIARLQGDEVNVKNDGLSTLSGASATADTHFVRKDQIYQLGTKSMVRVNGATAYGSTNTKIIRFTNSSSQGVDITYADSATLGGSFTINTSGVYAMAFSGIFDSAQYCGVSINTSAPTTSIASIPIAEIACINASTISLFSGASAATLYLGSGTVLRAHADINGVTNAIMSVTRVA